MLLVVTCFMLIRNKELLILFVMIWLKVTVTMLWSWAITSFASQAMVVDLERLYQRSSIECTLAQMDAADMRMRVESQSLALADLAAEWQVSQLALQDAHRLAARRNEQARHCVSCC
jgi:uncharacterized membrane protein (UPF0182 family)